MYIVNKCAKKKTKKSNIQKNNWWEMMDSNHRSLATTDLQSAPFGRSGNLPYLADTNIYILQCLR